MFYILQFSFWTWSSVKYNTMWIELIIHCYFLRLETEVWNLLVLSYCAVEDRETGLKWKGKNKNWKFILSPKLKLRFQLKKKSRWTWKVAVKGRKQCKPLTEMELAATCLLLPTGLAPPSWPLKAGCWRTDGQRGWLEKQQL